MAEDQGSHAIDFHLGNHLLVSSNSDNSGESKNNMKPLNQQNEEGEALVNKKRNREIASENEKDNITSDEGLDGKHPESNNEMFDDLRGLLPQLPSEADEATVIKVAANYIKGLEESRKRLGKITKRMFPYVFKEIMGTSDTILINGKKKLEFDKVWTSSNMVLNIHANWAQFTVCSAYKPHLLNTITSVLERHNIEVIAANVSFNHNENGKTCMILVHAKQVSDENSAEETYKDASGEIFSLIS
ncbi:hypothetical protein JHK85_003888 [Glycine max]|nr:hypothetical protein JHK87_003578 [Glycine soja]KAG5062705.1 hypothetical protein JHK85_003888 [Glycine max]KAG5079654.1 hypothetical protein JHK86_003719 [Glycine max]